MDTIKPVYWGARSSYRLATNRLRLLPDFIIIGTQRGGTTSLYYYLVEYAGVAPAQHKEVHFFDDHFQQGMRWYRAQFPTVTQKYLTEQVSRRRFVTGESSPYYLFDPRIPARVRTALPEVKLIVLLRNPVDRAYSHHWLSTHEGHETLSFEKALRLEEERLRGEEEKMLVDEHYESYNHRHYAYLGRGVYVDQLRTWLRSFPREQFLILKSEDLYQNPVAITKQTLEFLGLPPSVLNTQKEFKQYREPVPRGYKNNEKPPRMDLELRKDLSAYFKPHNQRLYDLLGRDFGWE
ncbi:MAG TPA: sulfotransferase domain-containing protein [Ktedonobacteraceae bacterium]|nr:sulfotransferase domain-containing protein [Ktedonobacteraceae bacterium]